MYKEGDLVEAMAYLLQDIKKIKINKVKEWEKKCSARNVGSFRSSDW